MRHWKGGHCVVCGLPTMGRFSDVDPKRCPICESRHDVGASSRIPRSVPREAFDLLPPIYRKVMETIYGGDKMLRLSECAEVLELPQRHVEQWRADALRQLRRAGYVVERDGVMRRMLIEAA